MATEKREIDVHLDPRVYFAAERTLLALVRTGLAMMGFGFVVARFGLFLRELAAVQGVAPHQHTVLSLWAGMTLVLLGVAVNVAGAVRHWLTVRRLVQGQPLHYTPWSIGMIIALLLGLLGVFMASYLSIGLDH